MSIKTKSLFYYGHLIDETNYAIDFKEGVTSYAADLPVGDYSLNEFITAVESVLNNTGTLDYVVTVDRETRIITISASGNFQLLISTGRATTAFALMGFSGLDTISDNEHIANLASGYEWRPQPVAEDYLPKEDNDSYIQPTINESTSGEMESIYFGERRFIEANVKI